MEINLQNPIWHGICLSTGELLLLKLEIIESSPCTKGFQLCTPPSLDVGSLRYSNTACWETSINGGLKQGNTSNYIELNMGFSTKPCLLIRVYKGQERLQTSSRWIKVEARSLAWHVQVESPRKRARKSVSNHFTPTKLTTALQKSFLSNLVNLAFISRLHLNFHWQWCQQKHVRGTSNVRQVLQ